MDRKTFLKNMLGAGVSGCFCGVAWGQTLGAQFEGSLSQDNAENQDWISKMEKRMVKATETPPSRVADKARVWLKDLMDNMDTILDEKTKINLMNACGRSCYANAFGVASEKEVSPQLAEAWMKYLKDAGFEIQDNGSVTVVHFGWKRDHQNPLTGLILKDGYCMCELAESIPKNLSPTFCNCSAGYVGEMFKRYLGKTVKVDVLETLLSGGSECRFRIEIPRT
jgi:hypothetical protein